jgi:hypothetical protein
VERQSWAPGGGARTAGGKTKRVVMDATPVHHARRAKRRSQLFGKAGEMSRLYLLLSLSLSPAGLWRLAAALRLRGVVRGRMIASVQPPRRNGERARCLLCHLLQGPGCMVYLPCLRGRAPGGQEDRPGLASLVLVPVRAISGARVCPVNGQRPPCTIP